MTDEQENLTPEQENLLNEWKTSDPTDFGQLIRFLTLFALRYEKAKKPDHRRFWILQQLDLLTRFGESLCPGDQLKPVRDLIMAMMGLDRGVESPMLMPRYWTYPKPIVETVFRARMAAAVQMYHESGMKIRSAASLVIRTAGTPDVEVGQIEDWRQAFLRGDPETDIGASYYHLWTNPESGIVVGPSESASGTDDDPQADMDVAVYDHLHPGELVGWSGGALRTKAKYAEWLARTADRIRNQLSSIG
jgi:hypothetical protein